MYYRPEKKYFFLVWLDPYTPSEEERNDPRLFAENVRQVGSMY